MIRSHASFRGEFSKDRSGTDPAGESIANLVSDHLTKSGFTVSNRDSSDYSHTFDVRVGTCCFHAAVGLVDDGDREWLFFADSTLGRFARFFGASDAMFHTQLLQAVHELLSGDHRVSALSWYTADEWEINAYAGVKEPTG